MATNDHEPVSEEDERALRVLQGALLPFGAEDSEYEVLDHVIRIRVPYPVYCTLAGQILRLSQEGLPLCSDRGEQRTFITDWRLTETVESPYGSRFEAQITFSTGQTLFMEAQDDG